MSAYYPDNAGRAKRDYSLPYELNPPQTILAHIKDQNLGWSKYEEHLNARNTEDWRYFQIQFDTEQKEEWRGVSILFQNVRGENFLSNIALDDIQLNPKDCQALDSIPLPPDLPPPKTTITPTIPPKMFFEDWKLFPPKNRLQTQLEYDESLKTGSSISIQLPKCGDEEIYKERLLY